MQLRLQWRIGETVFERFGVLSIKSGGMANVYVCDDLRLERRVALKIPKLRLDQLEGWGCIESMRSELSPWLRLGSHPYVVQLLGFVPFMMVGLKADFDPETGRRKEGATLAIPSLLLEFGGTMNLREYLRCKPDLALREKLRLLMQACNGLRHCADRGVSPHLDLKPENILVDDTGRTRVTDFGLSRISGTFEEAEDRVLEAGRVCAAGVYGTPAYMAPEQWQSIDRCDIRSDIYSFGIMAWEVIAGIHPFAGELRNLNGLRRAHLELRPSRGAEGIPPGLDSMLSRCVAKNPTDRFSSWRELEAALCDSGAERIEVPPAPKLTEEEHNQRMSATIFAAWDDDLLESVQIGSRSGDEVVFANILKDVWARKSGAMRQLVAWTWGYERIRSGWMVASLKSIGLVVKLAHGYSIGLGIAVRRNLASMWGLAVLGVVLAINGLHVVGLPLLALWGLIAGLAVYSRVVGERTRRRCINCMKPMKRLHAPGWFGSMSCGTVDGIGFRRARLCMSCGQVAGYLGRDGAPVVSWFRTLDAVRIMGVQCELPRWRWQARWPKETRFGVPVGSNQVRYATEGRSDGSTRSLG